MQTDVIRPLNHVEDHYKSESAFPIPLRHVILSTARLLRLHPLPPFAVAKTSSPTPGTLCTRPYHLPQADRTVLLTLREQNQFMGRAL